ncbi:MAG TPA: beta-L-arabinofuranosidase domain-containing protein [Rhodothermales bacterium]|nr:beta-L-arabinofuranosidase domain-containing protein [Rhodothermales bacterium]
MFQFVSHANIRLGGFWAEKQKLVRGTTIPYQWEALNDRVPGADRSGAVSNFKIAAGRAKGEFHGFVFQDSDLAKWIEAAAYAIETGADVALKTRVDRLIDLIAAAQDDNGYLNTYYTIKESPELRWSDLRDKHEMYVSGHMLEAAIAYFRATGDRKLLDVMIRNIDLIGRLLGRGRGKRPGYPGHPEIELALMRLYDLTRDERHLRLAKYFIHERGRSPRYFDQESRRLKKKDFRSDEWHAIYNQSHAPIREMKDVVGHAVRACYLFAAAADVARETGDRTLFRAVKRLWKSATERRMYLTGGVGSTLLGEAFTFDFDLPNEWAYAETCAAIALVFWSRRMLQVEIDGRYGDVMERVLYNGFLSALSEDGTHCFYRNPLADVPDPKYPKRHIRRAWHECACCPPNVSRLMMSLGGYAYSQRKRSVFVHLFLDGTADLDVDGTAIQLVQETRYPWSGRISIRIETPAPVRFRLAVRIPGWSRTASVTVGQEAVGVDSVTKNGYASIDRRWEDGDTVVIDLPMAAERVRAHPKVRQDARKVAIQRGPIVYCFEEADNGPDLHELVLPESAELRARESNTEFGRIPIISATGLRTNIDADSGALYRTDVHRKSRKVKMTAVPYYLWANRGMGEMCVWVNENEE